MNSCVIFDTDVGTDDAMAFLAWKLVPFKPDYIIAEHGNTTLDGAFTNARILKILLDLDARIVKGVDVDTSYKSEDVNAFHGPDGIGNTRNLLIKEAIKKCGSKEKYLQQMEEHIDFDDFKEKIRDYEEIIYIATGPLTNLVSLLKDEKLIKKFKHIYIMGGGINEFNSANDTEFNFSKDPESVHIIINSGLDITLFPLDLTNRQYLTPADIDSLSSISPYPEFVEFLRYNLSSNRKYNQINGAVLHDVMPILYLNPVFKKMFKTRRMLIAVDKFGKTYVDKNGKNINVVVSLKKNLLFIVLTCVFSELCSQINVKQ